MDKETGRYYLSWLLKGVSVKELEIATRIQDLDHLDDDESLALIENLIQEYKLSPSTQRWLFTSVVAHKKQKVIKLYIRSGFDKDNQIEFDFYQTNQDIRPVILFC